MYTDLSTQSLKGQITFPTPTFLQTPAELSFQTIRDTKQYPDLSK